MAKKYLFYFLILSFGFSGCEKNPYFQFESTVSKKIQRRWELVRVNPAEIAQEWVFNDGKVYRIGTAKIPNDTLDVGTYSVSTSISEADLFINNFKIANYLNTRFTISTLDDDALVIIGVDGSTNAGTVYREFVAKK